MKKLHNRDANLPATLAAVADGIAEACWLASIVVVALHFNLHTFTIFEPDKVALFQILTSMLLAALVLRVSVWHYSAQTTTAAGAAAVIPPAYAGIAAALLLSTALSIAPQVSWNGSYLRAHGTLYELCLLAVLVAQCVGLRRPAQLQRLLDTIVLAATVSALYGILQHFGLDPAEWGKSFLADRVSSTQGNPIFFWRLSGTHPARHYRTRVPFAARRQRTRPTARIRRTACNIRCCAAAGNLVYRQPRPLAGSGRRISIYGHLPGGSRK